MKNRALLSALSVALTLPGCVADSPRTWGGGPPTKICDEKGVKCDLVVTVDGCSPTQIHIDHEVLGVLHGAVDVDIRWTIDTPGYEFPKNDGIKFKGSAWPREFDLPKGNQNKYKWRDHNRLGKVSYDYTITVIKSDGSPCASRDPTIINNA